MHNVVTNGCINCLSVQANDPHELPNVVVTPHSNISTPVYVMFPFDFDDGGGFPSGPSNPGSGGGSGGFGNGGPLEGPCGSGGGGAALTDENGYYYSRKDELTQRLEDDPFALEPCDSLNIMPLGQFGEMWRDVAQFQLPQNLKNRIDSVNNVFSNPELTQMAQQSLDAASGTMVNCDFFPVNITQMPIGFTAQSLLEYFRLHINNFITPSVTASSFNPYGFEYLLGGASFSDTTRFSSSYQGSIGSFVHIHIAGNSGTVMESRYPAYDSPPNSYQSYSFTFSTLSSPLDNYHPVGGNRDFGIYNSPTNPNQFTFYIMGVDRTWDWMDGLLNNSNNPLGNMVFDGADKLWTDIQQNFINYIKSLPGGQASFFTQKRIVARPNWDAVKDYLKGYIDFTTLKLILGC